MKPVFILLLIIIFLFTAVFPAFADEIEWVDPQEKTLRMAETFSREGFVIEASDFYNDSYHTAALITVYDISGNFVTRNITMINDYIVVNDLLNITVINIEEVKGNISALHGLNVTVDQWVRISTSVVGKPAPIVSIIPYERLIDNKMVVSNTFTPGSEIAINFSVKNEGKAVLKSPRLRINSTLPLFSDDKLSYELISLKNWTESEIITVHFKAPITDKKKLFVITAEVFGNDVQGRSYRAVDVAYVEVKPTTEKIDNIERLEIRKFVTEKVYIGDIAMVSITIKNNGSRTIANAFLIETPPAGLLPLNTNLTWNFTLAPFEQRSISYRVKPEKPGTYYFIPGSSRVEYMGREEYNTKLARLIVNGPYVVLKKSANNDEPVRGDNLTVTVTAKNMGSSTAIVKFVDSLPSNFSLSRDNDSYKTIFKTAVLHPGDSVSLASYILNTTTSDSFILPQAKATVLDQYLYQDERYTQRIVSNNLTITVGEPVEPVKLVKIVRTPRMTARPINISDVNETSIKNGTSEVEKSSGFQGYISVLAICMIILINKKKFSKYTL